MIARTWLVPTQVKTLHAACCYRLCGLVKSVWRKWRPLITLPVANSLCVIRLALIAATKGHADGCILLQSFGNVFSAARWPSLVTRTEQVTSSAAPASATPSGRASGTLASSTPGEGWVWRMDQLSSDETCASGAPSSCFVEIRKCLAIIFCSFLTFS